MKARFEQAKGIKKILGVVKTMTPECKIYFAKGKFMLLALDASNASSLKYEYTDCDTLQSWSAVVQLEHIDYALKRADDKSPVEFITEDDHLEIRYEKPRSTRHVIPLLDDNLGLRHEQEPKLTALCTKTIVETEFFSKAIEECSEISPTIILINQSGLSVVGKADAGARKCDIVLPLKHHDPTSLTVCRYAATFLENFLKLSSVYEEILIEFNNNYPLRLSAHDEKSEVRLIVAPIVANE